MDDADELSDSDTPRTAEEIARRAIALHCVIAAAHGVSKDAVSEWLKEEQLWNEVTPREFTFLTQTENPRKEIIHMTWLVEANVALLWAIGKLDALPPPTSLESGLVIAGVPGLFTPTSPFIESAVLRDREEIVREEANIYDIHCDCSQAKRHGKAIPNGYDKDVVFYRHYGLCWVRGYCGQLWDDVTPDT